MSVTSVDYREVRIPELPNAFSWRWSIGHLDIDYEIDIQAYTIGFCVTVTELTGDKDLPELGRFYREITDEEVFPLSVRGLAEAYRKIKDFTRKNRKPGTQVTWGKLFQGYYGADALRGTATAWTAAFCENGYQNPTAGQIEASLPHRKTPALKEVLG